MRPAVRIPELAAHISYNAVRIYTSTAFVDHNGSVTASLRAAALVRETTNYREGLGIYGSIPLKQPFRWGMARVPPPAEFPERRRWFRALAGLRGGVTRFIILGGPFTRVFYSMHRELGILY